jgi:DNA invertase Pin-like site-specific DNA recombinase
MKDATPTPIAYSYVRFSSPEQAKGDSLRRQTAAAAEWCERNGLRLDSTTTLHDLGKSAFTGAHRKNPDRHALAAFLKLVEAGKVPRGSFLIIENLDRLSREEERAALRLWMDLLDSGINIVQLSPETVFRHEKSDMVDIMRAIIELARGHGESAIKSKRVGEVWVEKRRKAREGSQVLTRRLPAWVEERDGKLRLVPARTAAVRRVFQLAASGYGCTLIVKRLVKEKVPPIGSSGAWTRSYVGLLLHDRRTVGEFQPRHVDLSPSGEPIPNYYPLAITEDEWLAARAGAVQRRDGRGRAGGKAHGGVNVFAGLTNDARGGGSYVCTVRLDHPRNKPRSRRHRVLIVATSLDGRSPSWSFPFEAFERAVLEKLSEVDPREVLGQDDGPSDALVLAGELARVEASIGAIVAEMDEHGESPTLFKRLRAKEDKQRDLSRRLAEARLKAASPLSEAWGECQSLLATLDAAPDPEDARVRLRSVLRRVVGSVWLLVVPRGRDRLAAVQIWFAGGEKHRDYIILHRPARANAASHVPGKQWVESFAEAAVPGDLDLRCPADAATLAAVLEEVGLESPGRKGQNREDAGQKGQE